MHDHNVQQYIHGKLVITRYEEEKRQCVLMCVCGCHRLLHEYLLHTFFLKKRLKDSVNTSHHLVEIHTSSSRKCDSTCLTIFCILQPLLSQTSTSILYQMKCVYPHVWQTKHYSFYALHIYQIHKKQISYMEIQNASTAMGSLLLGGLNCHIDRSSQFPPCSYMGCSHIFFSSLRTSLQLSYMSSYLLLSLFVVYSLSHVTPPLCFSLHSTSLYPSLSPSHPSLSVSISLSPEFPASAECRAD